MLRKVENKLLIYSLLLGFLLIAYLPVSSCWFALKNDALVANFPNKYFFSAALHAHTLPLWNPYVNFGLPLYADPGFSFWHPLTWIFGLIGYNVYTLSIELLIYIWLGGIFMYQLGRYFGHLILTSFLMGILYMCCGFFIGNLSHTNFLTSAAFLPLVTRTFLQLQTGFSYKKVGNCAIGIYLLLAGGHPAIPFAALYFFAILLVCLLLIRSDAHPGIPLQWNTLKANTWLLISAVGLTAPILLSWMEILPHLTRASPVLQETQQDLGFTFPSYISFIFPFATTAYSHVFFTDVTVRNGYFSFIGLSIFVVTLFRQKNRYQKAFLISGAIMLLLCLGGPIKALIYNNLPLLKFIRTNGEFRVFPLLCFIVSLSFPLDGWLKDVQTGKAVNRVLAALAAVSASIVVVTGHCFSDIYNIYHDTAIHTSKTPDRIKWMLDHLTLSDRLLINASILLVWLLLYFFLRKKIAVTHLLPGLIMIDLVSFCWMHLPVTGVQRKSPAEIASLFSSIPPGIPIPQLSPISGNTRPDLEKIIGCWSYYSKQPGTPKLCGYPTLFTSTRAYFNSPLPPLVDRQPFLFLRQDSAGSTITIKEFSPRRMVVSALVTTPDSLVVLQNAYSGWEAEVNGRQVTLAKEFIAFMAVPLEKGRSEITLRFTGGRIVLYLLIALLIAALLGWLILMSRPARDHPVDNSRI